MVFPTIMPANSVSGFNITNSLRFNDGDSPQLNLANVGTVTNNKIFTYSVWIKKSSIESANQSIISAESGNNRSQLLFRSGSNDAIRIVETSDAYTSFNTLLTTAALFRDPSAWYHIVLSYDSTDGTAGDRVKIYVNSVLQTLSGTTADSNFTTPFNEESYNLDIGHLNNSEFLDGHMSDAHFIDGQALTPTSFGETNDNGVWIPKIYTGTFGLNGFKLEFKQTGTSTNSSGIGADTSGNDRHFAVSNLAATDITEDTPTNNFATMNPLDNFYSAHTMSEGNVKFVTNGTGDGPFQTATIGDLKSGKWYFEFKYTDPAHTGGGDAAGEFYGQIGICGSGLCAATNAAFSSFEHNFAYDSSNGRIKFNNTAGTVHGSQIAEDGQIIGFLVDLDNNKVSTHKNGSYADGSGNHDESFGNAAFVDVTAPESTPLGGYFIAFGENVASDASGNQNTGTYEINFGNPSFAISSSNADANGHGNFEYAVPSGYFALCTKNLAEYG